MGRIVKYAGILIVSIIFLLIAYSIYVYLTSIDDEVRQGSAYGFTVGEDKKTVSLLVKKYTAEGRFNKNILTVQNGKFKTLGRTSKPDKNVWVFEYEQHEWLISKRTPITDIIILEFDKEKLILISRKRLYLNRS